MECLIIGLLASTSGTKQSAFPSLSQTYQYGYSRSQKLSKSLNQKSNLKQTRPFFVAATAVLLLLDKDNSKVNG
jgi:hypothetical protein